jgi:hypothetical protein
VVFRKAVDIDGREFLVEIMRKAEEFRIVLYDAGNSESFSLQIGYGEALEIMGGREDFKTLVGMFKIKNDEIMLIAGEANN